MMKLTPSLSKSTLTQVLIGAALLAQIVIITLSIIKPLSTDILDTRNLQAVERSAVLRFGDRFAGYIEFIRSKAAEADVFLIPYPEIDEVFGNVGMMQYFLLPHRISNCPEGQSFAECARVQAGPSTLILSVDGFPPGDIEDDVYNYVPYDDGWGIYLPAARGQ